MSIQNTFNPVVAQTPAAATDAVCTMAAPTDGSRWIISSISYSYSATPTAGKITIAWGSFVETYYIPAGGTGQLEFGTPKAFPANTQVVVTLVSGAGAVLGSVYVDARTGS